MKLVKQSFEILEQEIPVRKLDDYSGEHFREQYIQNMYKHIEKCGRTCYRSEHRITENSAEKFVNGLIKRGHYSVLEHGVVYLQFTISNINVDDELQKIIRKYNNDEYSKINSSLHHPVAAKFYITTNFRRIVEQHWEEDLQFLCEPTEYHEKRHTVLLHSCIHVYKDLTRHRKMSFSIESTRYVNYSKINKFGEMKFIEPCWQWKDDEEENGNFRSRYMDFLRYVERTYLSLVDALFPNDYERSHNYPIWQPQQAAEILPQCTAADVVMSGFSSDWEFVFRLRSNIAETGQSHPLVEELMTPLRKEFSNRKYIKL